MSPRTPKPNSLGDKHLFSTKKGVMLIHTGQGGKDSLQGSLETSPTCPKARCRWKLGCYRDSTIRSPLLHPSWLSFIETETCHQGKTESRQRAALEVGDMRKAQVQSWLGPSGAAPPVSASECDIELASFRPGECTPGCAGQLRAASLYTEHTAPQPVPTGRVQQALLVM